MNEINVSTEEPIVVYFLNDLTAVEFRHNGQILDARVVLNYLAMGKLHVVWQQEKTEPKSPLARVYVKSETWKIVPNKKK